MKKIRRVDAIKAGLNRYFTGVRCSRGHLSERRTGNGACVKCAQQDWDTIYTARYKKARKNYAKRMTDVYNEARAKNGESNAV